MQSLYRSGEDHFATHSYGNGAQFWSLDQLVGPGTKSKAYTSPVAFESALSGHCLTSPTESGRCRFVQDNRSEQTCRALWSSVVWRYKKATCYSDFWQVYQNVIPSEQHHAVGKESGETAHIERFNNTLRQRVGRFVRKTLSFSKCEDMHFCCLMLFIHRYNLKHVNIRL